MKYMLDTITIDAASREVTHGGAAMPVEPKVFDLILYLVKHRDRVVMKDELVSAVWQGRFISDAAISSAVSAARRAVGDTGQHQAS